MFILHKNTSPGLIYGWTNGQFWWTIRLRPGLNLALSPTLLDTGIRRRNFSWKKACQRKNKLYFCGENNYLSFMKKNTPTQTSALKASSKHAEHNSLKHKLRETRCGDMSKGKSNNA